MCAQYTESYGFSKAVHWTADLCNHVFTKRDLVVNVVNVIKYVIKDVHNKPNTLHIKLMTRSYEISWDFSLMTPQMLLFFTNDIKDTEQQTGY